MQVNKKADKNDDGVRLVEEMYLRQQAEEKVMSLEEKIISLEEKLSIALAQMSAKEASISHHQKALEEANTGKSFGQFHIMLCYGLSHTMLCRGHFVAMIMLWGHCLCPL